MMNEDEWFSMKWIKRMREENMAYVVETETTLLLLLLSLFGQLLGPTVLSKGLSLFWEADWRTSLSPCTSMGKSFFSSPYGVTWPTRKCAVYTFIEGPRLHLIEIWNCIFERWTVTKSNPSHSIGRLESRRGLECSRIRSSRGHTSVVMMSSGGKVGGSSSGPRRLRS